MATPRPTVLVVEDELAMRRFIRTALESSGFTVIDATTVREGLGHAAGRNPEIILLDLGLPDGDGIELLHRVREWSTVPVIVLSARDRELDKVAALDAGADDYLVKPFSVNELLARMRVAERHAAQAQGGSDEPTFTTGDLRIDFVRRQVFVGGREVHLTPTEYRLLTVLARHAGKVLTHRMLLKEVWGMNFIGRPHYLRVYMLQLRQKLEAEPARPRYLQTESGVGYRLRMD